ncbi:sigma-70 family RNA polymerase sigma factor, partial [Streptomyces sp. SID5770]|uniref:sigma-70 family RNA polymerase sigma factor n=1 Tax=Streptomyces sp. SID5770 TaxID=2690308 RepID=UPI00136C9BD6
ILVPFLPEPEPEQLKIDDHRTALLQALSALSPRQRTVVILRYWEDMSENEVAEILNCSLGTVKTHAHRGLTALRAHPALTSFTGAAQ